MKQFTFAAISAISALLSVSSHAFAWLQVHNATPNRVWVTVAASRLKDSTLILSCGGRDYCGIDDSRTDGAEDYRIQGWYIVAAGATGTVETGDANWTSWEIYAEDDYGRWWGGTNDTFWIPRTVHNHCGLTHPTDSRALRFFSGGGTSYNVSCGLPQGAANRIVNLTL